MIYTFLCVSAELYLYCSRGRGGVASSLHLIVLPNKLNARDRAILI